MSNKRKKVCKKCGQCCNNVWLTFSPSELEQNYKEWKNETTSKNPWEDVYLLYPMLRFKYYNKEKRRWIYRCIHLEWAKNRKAKCAIHKYKPNMCSGFPYYSRNDQRMGIEVDNPSQHKGCGYNDDPEHFV